MTIKELYDLYVSGVVEQNRQLIFCDFETQEGFQIDNIDDFKQLLKEINAQKAYIMQYEYDEQMTIYEYLVMSKTEPVAIVMNHPELTNAFWKDIPDKIIDSFDIDGNIYRYLKVNYHNGICDYVIELSEEINDEILNYVKRIMPSGFQYIPGNVISVLFSNSDRFVKLNQLTFVPYNINRIYPEWEVKNKNINNTSQKFWKEIKEIANNAKK
jgi:hypothetical protein